MLSNPPYGKSWKSDLERMGGKDGIKDPRFVIEHAGDAEYSLVNRTHQLRRTAATWRECPGMANGRCLKEKLD
jgi:type I restriction-modification system DNA methylase subunit